MSGSKIKTYCTTCEKEVSEGVEGCCQHVEEDCVIQYFNITIPRGEKINVVTGGEQCSRKMRTSNQY